MTAVPQDPELVRRYIDHCVTALRDVQKLAAESQSRHDQMLIWSIGLMGAGIFSAYGHLSIHSRFAALAPWVLGILSAIAARLIGHVVSDRDELMQFEKAHTLLALLLMPPDTLGLLDSARGVVRNVGLEARYAATKRLNRYSDVLGWATHILFGAGVAAVAWRLS